MSTTTLLPGDRVRIAVGGAFKQYAGNAVGVVDRSEWGAVRGAMIYRIAWNIKLPWSFGGHTWNYADELEPVKARVSA